MPTEIKNSHILVTAAVPEEASGIKEQMTGTRQYRIGGRSVFKGRIGKVPVHLMETGPGGVNTAQSMTAAIEAGPPIMILMTGCAGGFQSAGVRVGDIGIATEENDAHLGVESAEECLPDPLPFDLEVIDGVSIGPGIPGDLRLSDEAISIVKEWLGGTPVRVVSGPFVTVSTVTATDRSADRLYDRFHACMESMEGSAGAHVAMHYGIPFLEIRCASNLVGHRDRDAWDLPLACRRSAEAAVMWIQAQEWPMIRNPKPVTGEQ